MFVLLFAAYVSTAVVFYGLASRNAPVVNADEQMTHPRQIPAEVIELFPVTETQRKAA